MTRRRSEWMCGDALQHSGQEDEPMKKSLAAGIVALALTFARPAFAQQPAVTIPVLLPLTGTAAFMGSAQSAALRIMEAYVNSHGGVRGRPVHFSVVDDQSIPANAVQLANVQIGHGVAALIGPAYTAECLAVAPLLKDGPVGFCTSPGISPPPGSYVYSAGLSSQDLAALLIRYFHLRGWNKIGVITSTDASGQGIETSILRAVARPEFHDVQIVGREHFNVSDLSTDAQLARLKADKPDAVIEWTAGTALGTLLRSTRDVGLDVPIATSNANMQFSQLDQYAAFVPHELYFPTVSATTVGGAAPGPIHDQQQIYFQLFKQAGVTPDGQNSTIWDPAMLIVSAYRAVGPDATAKQLQDYLQGLHSWVGINGVYDFRDWSQRGIGLSAGVVGRWDPVHHTFIAASRLGGMPK
jgi:branched-chain amino acid transport system substrate-binding protein